MWICFEISKLYIFLLSLSPNSSVKWPQNTKERLWEGLALPRHCRATLRKLATSPRQCPISTNSFQQSKTYFDSHPNLNSSNGCLHLQTTTRFHAMFEFFANWLRVRLHPPKKQMQGKLHKSIFCLHLGWWHSPAWRRCSSQDEHGISTMSNSVQCNFKAPQEFLNVQHLWETLGDSPTPYHYS